MPTLREVIDAVLLRASLEGGVDTNQYADEPVAQIIQSTFDSLFDMWWWPQFYVPADVSFALDGTSGTVTTDISSKIKRFIDIRYVWYGNNQSPLPRANIRSNPRNVRQQCIAPINDASKVFMVLPVTSNDTITLAYRTKPDTFEGDDAVIDFDKELLVLGAAYDYINSIGLNPGAEDKLQSMYQMRLQQQLSELQQAEVDMGNNGPIPTQWNWY